MCKREESPELGQPSENAGYRKLGEGLGWMVSAWLIILLRIYFEASAGWIGVWCLKKKLKLSDRAQQHFGNVMVTLGKPNNRIMNTSLLTLFQPNPHLSPFSNCHLFEPLSFANVWALEEAPSCGALASSCPALLRWRLPTLSPLKPGTLLEALQEALLAVKN